ncbi:MAG: peptidylprolyl isomerase [Candidatus Methanofastidiosia archaeon]
MADFSEIFEKYKMIIITISTVILLFLAYFILSSERVVREGDLVRVDFAGYLEDGTLFDTTIEEIALDKNIPKAPWFRIQLKYEPLIFQVGAHQVMPGLEKAVLGMKVGEEKLIRISPEDGFGQRDLNLIKEIDRVIVVPRFETITLDNFLKITFENPEVSKVYNAGSKKIKVLEVSENEVKLEILMEVGDVIDIPQTSFPSGPAEVLKMEEESYTLRLIPELSFQMILEGRRGIVIDITEDKITLDFNPFLAGRTLILRIILVSIEGK